MLWDSPCGAGAVPSTVSAASCTHSNPVDSVLRASPYHRQTKSGRFSGWSRVIGPETRLKLDLPGLPVLALPADSFKGRTRIFQGQPQAGVHLVSMNVLRRAKKCPPPRSAPVLARSPTHPPGRAQTPHRASPACAWRQRFVTKGRKEPFLLLLWNPGTQGPRDPETQG